MHGIFVGEIQALEGAGRTCWDFDIGTEGDAVPFELKLDMARQCWDEARHVEISVKLSEHMGTEIGEFAEQTLLFEAACNSDAILRLAGVNRALEGLAIDVFNTMRDFGDASADPVLYFCEDWMLADEVTHVKMGSRLAAPHHRRRSRAPQGRPRLPAHRRQAVQLRRLPRRGRGEPDPPGPQVPGAGRVQRRRDRRPGRRRGRGLRRGPGPVGRTPARPDRPLRPPAPAPGLPASETARPCCSTSTSRSRGS